MRRLGGPTARILAVVAAAYSIFHLAVLNLVPLDEWVFRALHVNVGAALAFLLVPAFRERDRTRIPLWDWLAAAAALACAAYIWIELDALVMRTGVVTLPADFAVGLVGTLLVLEFARRTSGPILPLLAGLFILYAFAGPWLPGILHHRGFDPGDVFSFLYSQEGIFGITTGASSRYIILFVGFAVFLQASGAGSYFIDLALALFGGVRGGPAKVSVVSGILFGTVSGSSVANVVATGTFTIPLMRRVGYPPASAAAVEATSSTGGQITPPVMGAGAFIMAEITGIPYADIVVAAILPCLLYYVAVYAHVDLQALRHGIAGLPRDQLPAFGPLLRGLPWLLPLFVLLVLLLSGYSVPASGTWAMLAAVPVMLARRLDLPPEWLLPPCAALLVLSGLGLPVLHVGAGSVGLALLLVLAVGILLRGFPWVAAVCREAVGGTGGALRETAERSLQLVGVCACAGIVVGILGLTGLGGRFSALVMALAGSSLLLALLVAMGMAIVLGMGMPTTAAYAIAASVVVPGLQQLGLDPLAAHLFVFYYAVVSAITPPVALASFAAAALAGADPWRTAFRALRFGIAAFVVPFMFVYHPEILLRGEWPEIVRLFATSALGVVAFAIAGEGWLRGPVGVPARLLLLLAAGLLLHGGGLTDLAGAALFAAVLLVRRLAGGRGPATDRPTIQEGGSP